LGIIAIYSNNPEYCCSDQGAKANITTVVTVGDFADASAVKFARVNAPLL
jgi:hypothetical protein